MQVVRIRITRGDRRLEQLGIRVGQEYPAEIDVPYFKPQCGEFAAWILSKDGERRERVFPREYAIVTEPESA